MSNGNEAFYSMVDEFYDALVRVGEDPKRPPSGFRDAPKLVAQTTWDEYLKRGGDAEAYKTPQEFTEALILAVGQVER